MNNSINQDIKYIRKSKQVILIYKVNDEIWSDEDVELILNNVHSWDLNDDREKQRGDGAAVSS